MAKLGLRGRDGEERKIRMAKLGLRGRDGRGK